MVYLSANGEVLGEFDEDALPSMLASGKISSEAYFWREGMADWRSVGELLSPPPPSLKLAGGREFSVQPHGQVPFQAKPPEDFDPEVAQAKAAAAAKVELKPIVVFPEADKPSLISNSAAFPVLVPAFEEPRPAEVPEVTAESAPLAGPEANQAAAEPVATPEPTSSFPSGLGPMPIPVTVAPKPVTPPPESEPSPVEDVVTAAGAPVGEPEQNTVPAEAGLEPAEAELDPEEPAAEPATQPWVERAAEPPLSDPAPPEPAPAIAPPSPIVSTPASPVPVSLPPTASVATPAVASRLPKPGMLRSGPVPAPVQPAAAPAPSAAPRPQMAPPMAASPMRPPGVAPSPLTPKPAPLPKPAFARPSAAPAATPAPAARPLGPLKAAPLRPAVAQAPGPGAAPAAPSTDRLAPPAGVVEGAPAQPAASTTAAPPSAPLRPPLAAKPADLETPPAEPAPAKAPILQPAPVAPPAPAPKRGGKLAALAALVLLILGGAGAGTWWWLHRAPAILGEFSPENSSNEVLKVSELEVRLLPREEILSRWRTLFSEAEAKAKEAGEKIDQVQAAVRDKKIIRDEAAAVHKVAEEYKMPDLPQLTDDLKKAEAEFAEVQAELDKLNAAKGGAVSAEALTAELPPPLASTRIAPDGKFALAEFPPSGRQILLVSGVEDGAEVGARRFWIAEVETAPPPPVPVLISGAELLTPELARQLSAAPAASE